MALGTGLQFRLGVGLIRDVRDAGSGIHGPGCSLASGVGDREAAVFDLLCRRQRPLDMLRSRTVTGFAAHVDFRPVCRIGLAGQIEVLLQIGGMAICTHEVPVEVEPGPVQLVPGLDVLLGVQVEPALSALRFVPAVPGDTECLHLAAGKLHQVLLQRMNPKGVGDGVVA